MKILIGGTPIGTLKHIDASTYRQYCGMLVSWRDGAKPIHALKLGAAWAMDNFAFTGFNERKWLLCLKRNEGVPGCLFSVSPDVVGDAKRTLLLLAQWGDTIKRHGYPVALALQNGLTDDMIPWGDIDAVFVGGDDVFKFSAEANKIVRHANALGKWTHNGRINSWRRWTYALHQGVKSVDGTGLAIDRSRIKEAIAAQVNVNEYLFVSEGA